jgi:hypothetical protein
MDIKRAVLIVISSRQTGISRCGYSYRSAEGTIATRISMLDPTRRTRKMPHRSFRSLVNFWQDCAFFARSA